jgi:hypothetical protein
VQDTVQNKTEADQRFVQQVIRDSSNFSPEQAAVHTSNNRNPDVPVLSEDALSSTGSQFVDATQQIDRADGISPVGNTPEAILKDMTFFKESWANLEDMA